MSSVVPDAGAMLGYLRSFAAGFGIRDVVQPRVLANTRRALAVAHHSRGAGRLDAFRAAAFDAYWRRGGGLQTDDELAAVSLEAGLDVAAAVAAATDRSALALVDEARRTALAAGVTAIPTFDVGNLRVVGCRPYDVLADAVRHGGAHRRAQR